MSSDFTKAVLVEIIEMLQMINKTIIDLSDDIMRNDLVDDAQKIEDLNGENEQWLKLFTKTADSLRHEKQRVKELEERVWQLESDLFRVITKP